MLARLLLAFGFGLAMPIALFTGALALAAEPHVVHELDAHRVGRDDAPGTPRPLSASQLAALPEAVRAVLQTAARAGEAKAVLDEGVALGITHILGMTHASSVLVELDGALLHLEMHARSEPTRAQAIAQHVTAMLANFRDRAGEIARELGAS